MCIDHNHSNYRESSTAPYLHLHHLYLTTPPLRPVPPSSRPPSLTLDVPHFVLSRCWTIHLPKLQALVYNILPPTEGRCRKTTLGVWYVLPKLQALVYDILLSLEEGAVKRCSECGTYCPNSKHWFTTSFFLWRKVPESDARSVRIAITCKLHQRSLCQTPSTGLRHPWRKVPESDARSFSLCVCL